MRGAYMLDDAPWSLDFCAAPHRRTAETLLATIVNSYPRTGKCCIGFHQLEHCSTQPPDAHVVLGGILPIGVRVLNRAYL